MWLFIIAILVLSTISAVIIPREEGKSPLETFGAAFVAWSIIFIIGWVFNSIAIDS